MKSLRWMCVYAAAAAMTVGSMAASAAVPDVRVNIPFQFVASGKAMPAGQYTFANQPSAAVMTLHADDGTAAMALVNYNAGSAATPEDQRKVDLVFEKKAGTFVLKEIRAGVKRAK